MHPDVNERFDYLQQIYVIDLHEIDARRLSNVQSIRCTRSLRSVDGNYYQSRIGIIRTCEGFEYETRRMKRAKERECASLQENTRRFGKEA